MRRRFTSCARRSSVRKLTSQFPRYILLAKAGTHGRFSFGALRHAVRSTVLGVMQKLSSIWPETDTLIVNEDQVRRRHRTVADPAQVLRVGVAARV